MPHENNQLLDAKVIIKIAWPKVNHFVEKRINHYL